MILFNKRKVILSLLLFTFIVSTAVFADDKVLYLKYDGEEHTYTGPYVNLVVNGEELTNLPMEPIVINERTLVPAREVFEALDATVMWVDNTQQILVTYNSTSVILEIGNDTAIVNGENVSLELAPKIIYNGDDEFGKTMIPVRFVGESLGFVVGWEESTATITIDNNDEDGDIGTPIIIDPDDNTDTDVVEPIDPDDNTDTDVVEPIDPDDNTDTDVVEPENPETIPTDVIPAVDISESELTEESHNKTNIYSVEMPSSEKNYITIHSTSKISKVEKELLYDNRLVLDIYNAELTFDDDFDIPSGLPFSEFRISQNQVNPELITRAVIQLADGVNYFVELDDSRTQLMIGFDKNIINQITFDKTDTRDFIYITGKFAPDVSIEMSNNPKQLIINLPNSNVEASLFLEVANGNYVDKIYTAPNQNGKTAIYANLKEDIQYNVIKQGNTTTVEIVPVTYQNIEYSNGSIAIKKAIQGQQIDLNNFTFIDDYINKDYSVVYNKNVEGYIGFGTIPVNDKYLSSIEILHQPNQTKLKLNTNTYIVVEPSQDYEYVYLNIKSPKEVYDKILVIDAGHGDDDPGAIGNGVVEKEVTLDVSLRLKEKIEQNTDIKVYMTRVDDTYPSFEDRVFLPNEIGDLFISVHVNSNDFPDPNGIETYYYPHANDAELGFSSKDFADITQKHLINETGLNDRKVKKSAWYVTRNTTVPGILVEIGFLSNPTEASLLKTDQYRDTVAQALYLAVVETFEVYTPPRN